MSFSLIIPAAANKSEYTEQMLMPKIFQINKYGISYCVQAALSLDLNKFDNVYFTILKEHDTLFSISDMLKYQFKRLGINADIIILDKPTTSQAETIYETICKANIEGSIFIKDADCACSLDTDIYPQNGIVVYPLESMSLVDPQHKSYVAIDDMLYITNTIEKRVIDHYFNAGGYCFENVEDFIKHYNELKNENGLYLSHIVYSMLLNNCVFRPFIADDYTDFDSI